MNQLARIENQAIALMPSASEWQQMLTQCSVLVKSGFLPSTIRTPEQAIAIALKGRELGMPMMLAFAHIYIIQGKPCMSAESMLGMIYKHAPGAIINYPRYENEAVTIEATRPGGKPFIVTWTMDDARKADLTGKDNWKKFSRAMLRSRCISEMARALFPDALQGVSYTPEELDPDVSVNEQGEIIDVPVVKTFAATTGAAPAKAKAPVIDAEPSFVDVQMEVPHNQVSGLNPDELEHLMNYTVPFGKKLKGKKVIDCQLDDLKSYADWLYNSAKKEGKTVSAMAKEFINMVTLFSRQVQFESANLDSGGAVIPTSMPEDVAIPF
jgi:hypothetical protein